MTGLHDATTASTTAESAAGCPVVHGADPSGRPTNGRWWPERLNLKVLAKNPAVANPLGADFDYAAAFATLAPLQSLIVDLPGRPGTVFPLQRGRLSHWP